MKSLKYSAPIFFTGLVCLLTGCTESSTAVSPPPESPVEVAADLNAMTAENDESETSTAESSSPSIPAVAAPESEGAVRFATYNVAMNRKAAGALVESLGDGGLLAGKRVAEIVQRVRPHVLLLNEVDYDQEGASIQKLLQNYFAVPQGDQEAIEYPYVYTNEVNTGVPSGLDLDLDGKSDGPGDGFGYGVFPGQYGMVVLSQFPIAKDAVRTLQTFLWKDMPDAALPIDPETNQPFYAADVIEVFRLSSKSHWDIPIDIRGATVHFLVCHPTPPVFDGPEDRNGKRNHDEVRLWADYIDPDRSDYIYDDAGETGGLQEGDHFVIAGDLNSDPVDGDSDRSTMQQLLAHPLVHEDVKPTGLGGGIAKAERDARANLEQSGDPSQDTGDFPDKSSGNLRVDYVLPGRTLNAVAAGVFWPGPDHDGADLVRASDHRLVWIDVEVP